MAAGLGFKSVEGFSSPPTKKLVTPYQAEKLRRVLKKYGLDGMPAAQAKQDIARFATKELLWSGLLESKFPATTLYETEKYIASSLQICTSVSISEITVEQNKITIPQKAASHKQLFLLPAFMASFDLEVVLKAMKDSIPFAQALDKAIKNILWPEAT